MRSPRVATTAGKLARLGFEDSDTSATYVEQLGQPAEDLVHLIASVADPDLAVKYLAELAAKDAELLPALVNDEGTAMRLFSVLGASSALGDHLLRHPSHWRELLGSHLGSTRPPAFALRAHLLSAVGADPGEDAPYSTIPDADALNALRSEYRRLLLRLAARDLAHEMGVDDVAAELSDLAGAALETGLAIARARVGESATTARLAVIAMGKCGGHELNYVSEDRKSVV